MTTALVTTDAQFMPALSVEKAGERYRAFREFVQKEMVEGRDYGKIPGSEKPSLQKPGAEKLCTFFGMSVPPPVIEEKIEDWTGKDHGEPLFYYRVRQDLSRGDNVWSQMGSCNSWESKYRYRWVTEQNVPPHLTKDRLAKRPGAISEFDFAIQKGETSGKYGKPAEYWQRFRDAIQTGQARQVSRSTKAGKEFPAWEIDTTLYRIPNDDVFSQVNTILKMAEKRAFVAACLIATNASEYYTQDLEDLDHGEATSHAASVDVPATDEHGEIIGNQSNTESTSNNNPPEAKQPAKSEPPRQQSKKSSAPPPPKTGQELYDRITDFEKRLINNKLCQPGELMNAIRQEALDTGLSNDITSWTGDAITFGVTEARDFGRRAEAGLISKAKEKELRAAITERPTADERVDALLAELQIRSLSDLPAVYAGNFLIELQKLATLDETLAH